MDVSSLLFNLKNDKIGNGDTHKLSFTRNKNLNNIEDNSGYLFKFVIDGNKMSNKYKIFPISDPDIKSDESEERIIGIINNVGKYILKIQIMKERFDKIPFKEQKEILELINKYIEKYPHIKVEYT